MPGEKLHDNEKQKKDTWKTFFQQVLSEVQNAHGAQGNEIIAA
jgi:hypothetical protein